MTREEQITFKAGSIADGCIAHGAPWKEYHQGFIEGAKWADANPSQPSLPSNLDEAANRQAALEQPYEWKEEQDGSFGVTPLFVMSNIRSAFKAGAEWMARQGETIDGEVLTTSDYDWETIRIPKKLYPLGTEVTLQIRKKQ